jgi:hypothetical protein
MNTNVKIILTPAQRLEIEGAALVLGETMAGFMRQAALEKSIDMRNRKVMAAPPVSTSTTTRASAKPPLTTRQVEAILERVPAGMRQGSQEFADWYAGQRKIHYGET